MVSITSTIERFWGSGLTVPGRGFLLNNQLTDFDAAPVHEDGTPVANRPEGGKQPRRTALDAADTLGGKRPRSSMTPTLVLRDGQPFMAVGSPGGSRIFGIVLNVVTNVIDHDMDPQEAITAARIVNRGGAMEIEADLYDANPELIEALEALGHEVARQEPFGGAHAVMVDPETGRLLGGADPRREGHLAGY
jgi:gamma-glutamyltranspeptidase / glutathione hydrolase